MKVFHVGRTGTTTVQETSEHEYLQSIGIPADVSAGYDILTDDGMSPEKAAEVMAACKSLGRDAEDFARHMVKLRKAYRGAA